ncbi:MAG: cell division protein ZapA [Alphaproteobacteria bacterium]|nr:cell division protein ZapA [Alphaproteobacteria bacterium]
MAQMTVRINGYAYTVGCEDGQEAHLLAMAEQVDNRIANIKAVGGQSGEARLLVLAALLLADEVHDLRVELASAQTAAQAAQAARPPRAARDKDLARSLARVANRAEEIAATLERS